MTASKSSAAHRLGSRRSLPSAFGRFTVILSQHDELGRTVRQLRDLCAAWQREDRTDPAYDLDPVALLASWQRDLRAHFQTEEGDAYFGLFVREHPALVSKIADLRAEHTAMLEEIAALVELAKDRDESAAFAKRTQAVIRRFTEHEKVESVLMQDYLEGD